VRRGAAAVSAFIWLIAGCAGRAPVLSDAQFRPDAPASVDLRGVPFFPQEAYQCGPAALAAALSYSGLEVTPQQLTPRVYLPAKAGSLQVEMVAAARRYDRIPYVIPAALPALLAELDSGRPVVVFQNLGLADLPVWHFAVVVGYSRPEDALLLRTGRHERETMSAYNFLRTWEGGQRWGLVILRPGELPAADDPDGYLRAVAAKESVSGPATLLEAYRAAALRWPDNLVARFGYAYALQASGELRAAVEQYRVLLAQHPDQIAALNNLADALSRQGCRSEALSTVDRGLAAARDPLRPVLEQTRQEILAAPAHRSEPAVCAR
jgi:tetratricopeptide (TPR) repeat protein